MTPNLNWSAEPYGYSVASTEVADTQARVFLLAEAVSDGTWDWAVWSRRGRHSSLNGQASTRESAIRKAELAAGAIGRTMIDEAA